MKKLYFSTIAQGLERPVEAMLHKEGGVAVERVLPGAALYRSVREPAFAFVHQTFQVLFQMRPVATPDAAVKRLLATGEWLDRFPYGEAQGKRFRIVTVQGDRLVSANMRFVDMLETTICEHTGMRVGRERPEVELWVMTRPEAAYFLWRLSRRATDKQDGQLRGDVCAVAAFLAQCGGKSTAVLRCAGTALPQALKAACARPLVCLCADQAACRMLESRVPGVRAVVGDAGCSGLPDMSQQAAFIHLPVKAEWSPAEEDKLRGALYEARRVLAPQGRLVVIAALAHAQGTLRKARGVRVLARCDVTLSGQPSALWVLEPAEQDGETA